MAFETITPNMLLTVPGVGQTTGPQYATDVNNCLTVIDAHNHSNGSGVQITPAGLNINSDLSFIGNNALSVRSIRFAPQSGTLSAPDLGAAYVSGADLFYTDVNGLVVQITKNGAVNGAPGNIGGLTGTASVNFSANTFIFQSSTNTPGGLDSAQITIRNNTTGANGVTLQPINSLGTNYTLTLPTIPSTKSFATVDTSGNIAADVPLANAFLPSGVMMAFGGSSAPSGWLPCDGTAISRTVYASLFSTIGTSYGTGDGSTTFNVPDCRNVFVRGANASARTINAKSFPAVALGATVRDTTAVNGMTNANHGHTYISGLSGGGGVDGVVSNNPTANGALTAHNTNTVSIAISGDVETAPVYLGVNYIIKT